MFASKLVSCLLLLATPFSAAANGSFALIADAGSTGTRVYLFSLPEGEKQVKIVDVGKGPALSSFQDAPEFAAQSVREQLLEAKELIPVDLHATVPVSVFATAGMRLVPKEKQEAIYRGLREGLLKTGFAFNKDDLQARTISGREEGIFALLAANYLAKRVGTSLQANGGELMGVLDLGGSSTQVAAPPSGLAPGEPLVPKLGEQHTFVKSFLKLGMERMRQRTFKHFVDAAEEGARVQKAVPNPCSFEGFSEQGDVWLGKGEATGCEKAIASLLQQDQSACTASGGKGDEISDCLGSEPVHKPVAGERKPDNRDAAKFFLISGYLYVTDFARWWLGQEAALPSTIKEPESVFQTPTIGEIREAARVLCSAKWGELEATAKDLAKRHRFTGDKKIPHRCFEVNYVAALLSTGYGFGEGDRLFRVVEDIDGGEIEWTLGAFLHSLSPLAGHPPRPDLVPSPEL